MTVYSMIRTAWPSGGPGGIRPAARAWPRRRFSAGVGITDRNDPSGSTFKGVNTRFFLIRQARSAPVPAASPTAPSREVTVGQQQHPGTGRRQQPPVELLLTRPGHAVEDRVDQGMGAALDQGLE